MKLKERVLIIADWLSFYKIATPQPLKVFISVISIFCGIGFVMVVSTNSFQASAPELSFLLLTGLWFSALIAFKSRLESIFLEAAHLGFKVKGLSRSLTWSVKLAQWETEKLLLTNTGISFAVFVYDLILSIYGLPKNSIIVWGSIAVMFLLVVDWALIRYRISRGWYGSNAMEAVELVRFIQSRKHDGGSGGDRILPERKPRTVDAKIPAISDTAEA